MVASGGTGELPGSHIVSFHRMLGYLGPDSAVSGPSVCFQSLGFRSKTGPNLLAVSSLCTSKVLSLSSLASAVLAASEVEKPNLLLKQPPPIPEQNQSGL